MKFENKRLHSVRLKFDVKEGSFCINYPHFRADGFVKLETEKFTLLSSECKWKKKENIFYTEFSCGKIKGIWEIKIQKDSFLSRIKNTSSVSYKIKNLSLIFPWDKFSPLLVCREHFQYVNLNPTLSIAGVHTVGKESFNIPLDSESNTLTLFQNKKNKDSLLIGVATIADAITTFTIIPRDPHWDSHFGFKVNFQFESTLREKKGLSSPLLLFLSGNDPLKLLEEYGELWKKKYKLRKKPGILGWNSWDYYSGSVREKDVLANSNTLKKKMNPGKNKAYIIIDEGWECRWGNWEEANYYFPSGLKGIAEKIYEKGFIPGIWIAPYTASFTSVFVRYHPDCLLKDEKGNFIIKEFAYGLSYILDPTHPEVQNYIRKVFKNLKRCGFKYFKIDFVQIIEGRNFYSGEGPQAALRKSLELIRESIGKDCYLISGCYSLETGAGLLDAARVSADIHNFFSHIRRSAKEISARFWLNKNIWNNDPDFLIVRCPSTTDEKYLNRPYQVCPYRGEPSWMAGREADLTEITTWASVIILTGGEVVLSDNLCNLNNTGWKIIEKVIENRLSKSAKLLDLFSEEEIPSIWLGEEKNYYLLGVFNWEDREKEIELNLESLGIMSVKKIESVWEERELKIDDIKKICLLPHQCKLLKIIKGSKIKNTRKIK